MIYHKFISFSAVQIYYDLSYIHFESLFKFTTDATYFNPLQFCPPTFCSEFFCSLGPLLWYTIWSVLKLPKIAWPSPLKNKGSLDHMPSQSVPSVCSRVNREFVWEFKQGFVKAIISRDLVGSHYNKLTWVTWFSILLCMRVVLFLEAPAWRGFPR